MKAFVGELIGTFVLTLRICSRSGIVRRVWKHIPDRVGLGDWRYARYLLNPAFIMRAFESGRYSGHGAE